GATRAGPPDGDRADGRRRALGRLAARVGEPGARVGGDDAAEVGAPAERVPRRLPRGAEERVVVEADGAAADDVAARPPEPAARVRQERPLQHLGRAVGDERAAPEAAADLEV